MPVAPEWPVRSLLAIQQELCASGAPFEMDTISIRGVYTRVWKNAPVTIRAVVAGSREHGDRLATIYERQRITFDAQYRAVAALAQALTDRGIGKGDRVAIAMRNLPEWPVVFFAITALGAIAVPLNAWWTSGELEHGLRDSGAKLIVADAERWNRIAPIWPALPGLATVIVARGEDPIEFGCDALEAIIGPCETWPALPDRSLPATPIDPDDDATIFYTSGTTGAPKGALGTHRNLMSNVAAAEYVGARTALRRGDPVPAPAHSTALLVVPLFHVTACSAGLMTSTAAGNTNVLMRRWDPLEAMALIERERVTSTGGVPTIAWQLIEHPERDRFDLSSLKSIGYGGAPSAPELVRRIRDDFGAMPANGWGMTETMATVTSHAAEDYLNRPDSCGPALPVSDLRIVDPGTAIDCPPETVGELLVRGPQVVRGYWNNPTATAETFVDGWVRTGDLARIDEEGFCYIIDRAKDIVIRGGENIYSSEVENVLYSHPAVMDAALVGLPHRTLGEEPAAVVHLAPGAASTEDELKAWVRARLAAFKVPARIAFVPAMLPRNANGKILKSELKILFD